MKTRMLHLFIGLAALASVNPARAQGTAFTYQGRLTDNGAMANGLYNLRFRLVQTGNGQPLGAPLTNTVAVSNGLFTTTLDFGDYYGERELALEIGVRTNGSVAPFNTLAPNQVLRPSPVAVAANHATLAGGLAGMLPDSQLSPNVALLDGSPLFNAGPGVPPFQVATTDKVAHLNADLLDGLDGSAFWRLGGNVGTGGAALGTLDSQALTLVVSTSAVLRLATGYVPAELAPNLIGGAPVNYVAPGVSAATIAGGGAGGDRVSYPDGSYMPLAAPLSNSVLGNFSTVGGGIANTASDESATVAGGQNNTAGRYSTVGGGGGNVSDGYGATIPGGSFNRSSGLFTFAAGVNAQALHDGSFVWSDYSDPSKSLASTGPNQFLVRAAGGARFFGGNNWDVTSTEGDFRIGNDTYRLKIGVALAGGGAGDVWVRAHGGTGRMFVKTPGGTTIFSNEGQTSGVNLPPGGGSWNNLSDRNAKENLAPINPQEVLEKVAALPLATWNYKSQEVSIRHIGPMAQDFRAAFQVGESETGITTVDADGVALAAIQGLNQRVEQELMKKDAQLKSQQQQIAELLGRLQVLEQKLQHEEAR
jgi:hypothetical protein